MDYQPHFVQEQKNKNLELDRKTCESEANQRFKQAINNHRGEGAFGLLGFAVIDAVSPRDKNDDYYKTAHQIADECMTAKGYKLAN